MTGHGETERTRGRIMLCQEGRFRLASTDGRSTLFILSRKAPLEPQDLESLARRMAPVEVRHEPAPGLNARLAHDITEIDEHALLQAAPAAGKRTVTEARL